MAAQEQALRTNIIKTIRKQNVPAECRMAEKVMRQLAILYWDAKNLLKCDVNVVGKTRWCRQLTGTSLVCGMLDYDRGDSVVLVIIGVVRKCYGTLHSFCPSL